MAKKKSKTPSTTIAQNKKAHHDYHLETKMEAGIVLEGWEVKSLRMGNVQITDTYVMMKNGEAYLFGSHITPLNTVSTHYLTDPIRSRKLLLNKRELAKLLVATTQDGHTVVCTSLYWKNHLVKAAICIAKGKQQHDKRETEKQKDWAKNKQRVLRQHN